MSQQATSADPSSGEQPLAATFVRDVCAIIVVPIGLSLLQALLAPGQATRPLLLALWMGAVALLAYLLASRGRPGLAGSALTAAFFLMLAYLAYRGGGVRSTSYVGLIGLVFASAWLVGIRGGLLIGAMSALAGLGLLVAERYGWLPAVYDPETGPYFWYAAVTQMLVVLLLQWRLLRHLRGTQLARLNSEARYKVLFDHAADAIFVAETMTGRLLDANCTACQLVGRSLEQIRGMHQSQLHPPEDEARIRSIFTESARQLDKLQVKVHVVHADGRHIPVEVATSIVVEPDGRRVMLGVFRDVTERLRSEEELRASEERFRVSFEQAAVGMCHVGLDDRFLRVNRRFCEITGYTSAELIMSSTHDLTYPDDLTGIEALEQKLLAGEIETSVYEKRYLHKDGVVIWVNLTVAPIRGASGTVEQFLHVIEDITDRKLAEWALRQLNATLEERVVERTAALTLANEQLHSEIAERERAEQAQHESERQYRDLLESLQQGVIVFQDDHVVFCNQAIIDILGCPIADLLALPPAQLWAIIHSDDRQRLAGDVQAALGAGSLDTEAPFRIRRERDGADRWLYSASNVITYAGRPAFLAVLNDITDLKEVEARLRQSEARLHMLLANTPAVIFTSRADGEFNTTFVSDSIRTVLGYNPEAFTADARFWVDHVHPDDLPRLFAGIGPLFERGWHQFAYRFRHADERYRWVENGLSLLPGADDRPGEIIGYLIDITERKEAEEALRQSRDELRAANVELARAARLKDEFLANMSHELRTPLNAVLGRAELLREEVHGPLNERQLRSVVSIEESGRHLLELINDILDLSKIEANKLELQLEPMSVADLCQSSMRLVNEAAQKRQISLRTDLDPHISIIVGDPRRLKQILLNLLSNAVKFTPPGGQVGLEVRGDKPGGSLTFSVWDTGIGIADADLPRLFRPFEQLDSSLSRQYEGTGLGLSLVARLAKLHGGSVAVQSKLGQGSRFTVTLPWSPRESATASTWMR
ncbi:MAG: PAS domain S-box protein [Chloroflexales bacterium]|nr:PAS domain S-box protein [Chloroflexales bacterium]